MLEAQRLSARTRYDCEMMIEMGYCPGIENYSQPLSGRPPGSPPNTLFDFFPDDYLLFVDESHATVPQIGAMYAGDRNRKVTLVEHGFRLPSALDNRPLRFEEWRERVKQAVYVSATPGKYELEQDGRRGDRAGGAADGAVGPGDRGDSRAGPGAAFAGADSRACGRRASGCW